MRWYVILYAVAAVLCLILGEVLAALLFIVNLGIWYYAAQRSRSARTLMLRLLLWPLCLVGAILFYQIQLWTNVTTQHWASFWDWALIGCQLILLVIGGLVLLAQRRSQRQST